MDIRDNLYRGRAAEFLAAYLLETHGLRTTHVDIPGDDLWCAHPSGILHRVQVKSASIPRCNHPGGPPTYHFRLRRGAASDLSPYDGVYVFVATDLQLLLARRWDDTPPISCKIKPSAFTTEAMTESIVQAFSL